MGSVCFPPQFPCASVFLCSVSICLCPALAVAPPRIIRVISLTDKSDDADSEQAIWVDVETKLDAKNEIVFKALEDEVKTVVGTLDKREIERIEGKIVANQKINETNIVNWDQKLMIVCLIWRAISSKRLQQASPLLPLQVLALALQVTRFLQVLLSQSVMPLLALMLALVEVRLLPPPLGG